MPVTRDADFARPGTSEMPRTVTTIHFDGQFWVALVERHGDDGSYACARHVFGPEPNNAEVLDWAGRGFSALPFSPAGEFASPGDVPIPNPKRLKRAAAREMQARPSSTLAQQALEEAMVERKQTRRQDRAKRRRHETRARYELRRSKRKQARKGR